MRSRVELFETIRRERRLEGVSIRELADRHQVHRRTVRQALDSAVPPLRKAYPPRPRPAIEPWMEVIDGWLLDDQAAPRKQRHTARRIWQRLVAEHGATCSEVTVSRYVGRRRVELGLVRVEVSIPQTHPPGAEALCGTPHKASYEEPRNMRRRPRTGHRTGRSGGGLALGVGRIFTGLRGTQGACRPAGSGWPECRAGRSGPGPAP